MRHLILLSILGGAVGIPYFASGNRLDALWQWWNRPRSGATSSIDELAAGGSAGQVPSITLPGEQPITSEFAPPQQLTDVFRFDITIDWVMLHWPTVSTIKTNETDTQAFRVPLVSGIYEDDVAGSLTYYFGADRRLQRIVFEGTTGNADKLIAQVATPNGLERMQTNDSSVFLYQRMWNGQAASQLRIVPAPVITTAAPHRRFEVSLVLTRPTEGWF